MTGGAFKACPFCKEQIRQEAVKCRFCGEWLEPSEPHSARKLTTVEPVPPTPTPPREPGSNKPPQQGSAIPQDTTTPKASATTRTRKKSIWRLIGGIALMSGAANSWRNPPTGFISKDPGYKIQYLGMSLLLIAIGAWLMISFWSERPRRALLILGVAWLLVVAAMAYTVQKSADSNKRFGNAQRAFANDTLHYIEGGGSGTPPTMKPTGDATTDLGVRFINDFSQQTSLWGSAMDEELDALEEKDVFANSVLTNKASLETEANKRIESERIIEKYRTDLPRALDAIRSKLASYNISDKQKKDVLGAFDDLRPKFSHQYETVFDFRERKEKAELDFLYFMAGNEYELKNGKISFHSEMARQKYHDLSERIDDTAKDIAAFRKKQLEDLNAGIQKLSP